MFMAYTIWFAVYTQAYDLIVYFFIFFMAFYIYIYIYIFLKTLPVENRTVILKKNIS